MAGAFVSTWVSRFGVPLELVTDRGTQFESDLFKQLSSVLGFVRIRTTSYNPKANGLVERPHRTLKTILRSYKTDWIKALPLALFAMRITPSEATGVAPYTMVTGSVPHIPSRAFQSEKYADSHIDFIKKLASHLETLKFSPPQWLNSQKTFVPPDLMRCSRV